MNEATVIKDLIFKVVLKQAIEKAIGLIPFLGWPIIKQFFTWGLEKLGKLIYEEIERFLVFSAIDFEVNKQKEAYIKATEELKVAIDTKASDLDAKKQNFQNTLRDLIRIHPK